MDWTAAIEKNRQALKRILAMLFAMAGLGGAAAFTSPLRGGRAKGAGGGSDLTTTPTRQSDDCRPPLKGEVEAAPTLPRHLHRAILRLLRPAESAARRLVIVAARGLVVNLPPPRPRNAKPTPAILRNGVGTGIVMPRGALPGSAGSARPVAALRQLALPLFDRLPPPFPLRRAARSSVPRISFPGYSAPFPVAPRRAPAPDDPIDAGRLTLRVAALAAALDDLPRHVRRFARWKAARDATSAQNSDAGDRRRVRRVWPLRPGRPPGQRPARNARRPAHEIHDILDVVHGLAFWVLQRPDTS